jgi:hypothetical protein
MYPRHHNNELKKIGNKVISWFLPYLLNAVSLLKARYICNWRGWQICITNKVLQITKFKKMTDVLIDDRMLDANRRMTSWVVHAFRSIEHDFVRIIERFRTRGTKIWIACQQSAWTGLAVLFGPLIGVTSSVRNLHSFASSKYQVWINSYLSSGSWNIFKSCIVTEQWNWGKIENFPWILRNENFMEVKSELRTS